MWADSNWTFDCVHSALHGISDFTHLIQFKMVLSSSLAMLWMEVLVFVDCLCLDKFISYYGNFQFLHEVWMEELLKLLFCILFWLCTSGTLIWITCTFAIYVYFDGVVIFNRPPDVAWSLLIDVFLQISVTMLLTINMNSTDLALWDCSS